MVARYPAHHGWFMDGWEGVNATPSHLLYDLVQALAVSFDQGLLFSNNIGLVQEVGFG